MQWYFIPIIYWKDGKGYASLTVPAETALGEDALQVPG